MGNMKSHHFLLAAIGIAIGVVLQSLRKQNGM